MLIKLKLQEKRGDFILNSAFILLLVVALLALFISVAGVLMTWNKVNMMSTEMTRYIEVQGEVNSGAYNFFNELIESTNLNATITPHSSPLNLRKMSRVRETL